MEAEVSGDIEKGSAEGWGQNQGRKALDLFLSSYLECGCNARLHSSYLVSMKTKVTL